MAKEKTTTEAKTVDNESAYTETAVAQVEETAVALVAGEEAVINPRQENEIVSSILDGDITTAFEVITTLKDHTSLEMYSMTRPDDEDAISIGKSCKNALIEIDDYIVYHFNAGQDKVGIVIMGRDGNKYVTTSPYFIKEFLILLSLCASDGVTLDKIKVLHKTSKNKTADGQSMTYPMPTMIF